MRRISRRDVAGTVRILLAILVVMWLLNLTGCASAPPPPPFPTTGEAPIINEANAADIAVNITQLIATRLKPSDGTLQVGGNNPLIDKSLTAGLRLDHYRLVLRNQKHTVSYTVVALGPALLVRARVDDLQAAWLYRGGAAGEVIPASPTSLTEG